MRENKGNELKAKDNTGEPSYTWPRTINRVRESTGDREGGGGRRELRQFATEVKNL